MEPVYCEKCLTVIEPGMWPFCPHPLTGHAAAIATDDIPGGMVLENYGPHPITVYSHTERRAAMKAAGLELKEKFCPMPGTDIDPAGVQNPRGYVDAVTLANGAELICRQQLAGNAPDFDAVRDGVIRDQFSGVMTERDAIAVGEGDRRRSSRLGRRIANA